MAAENKIDLEYEIKVYNRGRVANVWPREIKACICPKLSCCVYKITKQ